MKFLSMQTFTRCNQLHFNKLFNFSGPAKEKEVAKVLMMPLTKKTKKIVEGTGRKKPHHLVVIAAAEGNVHVSQPL